MISRRVQGPIRGQILLNSQPMSLSLFQQRCGYVTHKCDLIPGLSVQETLYYTPTKVIIIFIIISKSKSRAIDFLLAKLKIFIKTNMQSLSYF